MRYGYAHVSTSSQKTAPQILRLQKAGCEKIVSDDAATGASFSQRPALAELREKLQPGDQVVVCALERLARSMKELMVIVDEFEKGDVHFRSLDEDINTSTADGALVYHVFAALARFERGMIRERTQAGLEKAKSRKQRLGREPSMSEERKRMARELIESGQYTREEIAHLCQVDRSTLYRTMRDDPAIPHRRRKVTL